MVEAARPEVGVLIDLDLAVQLREPGGEITIPASRIGTLPFMAIELLNSALYPPQHYYRHDLESFFYVLAWILANYEDGGRTAVKTFSEWCSGSFTFMAVVKSEYMSSVTDMPIAQFDQLRKKWLVPLAAAFRAGYDAKGLAYENGLKGPEWGIDIETLDHNINYDIILSILDS